MKKITTELCKEEIVKFIQKNPGCVASQFFPPEDEKPSLNISNWKRINKRRASLHEQNSGARFVREFDCLPYDDQLRAVVL